jgi:hypothetical protein
MFIRKNTPNAKKYGPNGEISPNLVTLKNTEQKVFAQTTKMLF